jgi:hypothetical protein
MKTLNALIKTDESITAVIDGTPFTMSSNHPSFEDALDAIASDDIDLLHSLFDVKESIRNNFKKANASGIEVTDSTILYNGEPVHNYVVDKIFEFMDDSLPFEYLVNFLDKLMANPSRRAVDELYKFLEHKHLPICPDGDFLAYKSVRPDFKDHHSGKFSNHVGAVLEMPRNAVCDDAEIGCSYGFHAGSHEYASNFGGGDSKLMIVKISPADVVSVPKDCDCQKLRTARYEVLREFERVYTKPIEEVDVKKTTYHNKRDSRGRFMKAR